MPARQILTLGLSATIQQTIQFDRLELDAVNRSTSYRLDASGKAVNAARVLQQLDPGSTYALCPLGEENADLFRALVAADGLTLDYVLTPGKTRYCYTLLSNGGHATELVVSEPVASGENAFAACAQELLALLERRLGEARGLILAGSRPASWPRDLYPRACALARRAEVPILADFHGQDLVDCLAAAPPQIVKINEAEFRATFGPIGEGEVDLAQAIADRSREWGAILVVTRGARDTFAAGGGQSSRCPVEALSPVNPIGSGDAFSAGFLHSWLEQRDLAQALRAGTDCARRNALSLRPGSIM